MSSPPSSRALPMFKLACNHDFHSLYTQVKTQTSDEEEKKHGYSQKYFAIMYPNEVEYIPKNVDLFFQCGDVFNDKIFLLCSTTFEIKEKKRVYYFYFINKNWFEANLDALKKGKTKLLYF